MGKMITMTDFLVKFHTLSVVFCPFAIQTPFFMVKNDLFFGKKKSIRILYQIRFSMKIERNICPVSPEIPTNVISPVIIVR